MRSALTKTLMFATAAAFLSSAGVTLAQQATPSPEKQPSATAQKAPEKAKEHHPSVHLKKAEITQVQEALAKAGFDPGKATGTLNKATRKALKDYQTKNGLKPTGTITTKTLNSLGISPGVKKP